MAVTETGQSVYEAFSPFPDNQHVQVKVEK